jgi:hypothetical protein
MPLPESTLPPFAFPTHPKTSPGGSVQFSVIGGTGGPYGWGVSAQSGDGVGITQTGFYTAGQNSGALDVVEVVDSEGNACTRDVEVMDGPTLASIRAAAKERADLVQSSFITDSSWRDYINGGYYELYDRLITAYDNDYNVAEPYVFITDGVTERWPLPPDFYKLMGLDLSQDLVNWVPIHRFNRVERSRYVATPPGSLGQGRIRSRLSGRYLWLDPRPGPGLGIRALYVPRLTKLTLDTDVLDGISGWEEYVILDATIKAKIKREEDASDWKEAKLNCGQRIDSVAENRDTSEPFTVVDLRSEEENPFNWSMPWP